MRPIIDVEVYRECELKSLDDLLVGVDEFKQMLNEHTHSLQSRQRSNLVNRLKMMGFDKARRLVPVSLTSRPPIIDLKLSAHSVVILSADSRVWLLDNLDAHTEPYLALVGVTADQMSQVHPHLGAPLPTPLPIVEVAAGSVSLLCRTDTGHVYVWGEGMSPIDPRNERVHTNYETQPRLVTEWLPLKAVKVAAGKAHQGVVLENGHLWIWGEYGDCQLGVHDDEHQPNQSPMKVAGESFCPFPRRVTLPTHYRIKDLALGDAHTVIVDEMGEVYSWGSSEFGQCGVGKMGVGVVITDPTHVTHSEWTSSSLKCLSLQCGAHTTFFEMISIGPGSLDLISIWACGDNSDSQLWLGNSDGPVPVPVSIDALRWCTHCAPSWSIGPNHGAVAWRQARLILSIRFNIYSTTYCTDVLAQGGGR
eukprot:GHVN01094907.1.p1 GENE.GHVN01094907.1~~GHVN01094907.1.p1  ORF type:complete len:466 (+),score=76.97 GHVN01094907.1:139-1398(+)